MSDRRAEGAHEIAVSDPGATFCAAREELIDAFTEVLDSGRYILGRHVEEFEREWAARCGTAHAVGLSSGTDALAIALRALGVGPGDEVLVPAMTAVATWAAVRQIGATPVGVDIEPLRNGIDPDAAAASVGERTRAIVAVHLFGQPADIEALERLAQGASVALVEDAAQAHGASDADRAVGSLGRIASFSFYPTKNLGAIGDAGAVTTSDAELAERARMLREYGWREREDARVAGFNARLDELQAAVLQRLLPRLEAANLRRRQIAEDYSTGLADVAALTLPAEVGGCTPVWHQYVVRHPRRDDLARALARTGIATAVHYRTLPPLNPGFRDGRWREGMFPMAERHAREALSLPMHAALGEQEVTRVIEAVRAACAAL